MYTLAALIAAGALAPGEGVLRVKFQVRATGLLCCVVCFVYIVCMYVGTIGKSH